MASQPPPYTPLPAPFMPNVPTGMTPPGVPPAYTPYAAPGVVATTPTNAQTGLIPAHADTFVPSPQSRAAADELRRLEATNQLMLESGAFLQALNAGGMPVLPGNTVPDDKSRLIAAIQAGRASGNLHPLDSQLDSLVKLQQLHNLDQSIEADGAQKIAAIQQEKQQNLQAIGDQIRASGEPVDYHTFDKTLHRVYGPMPKEQFEAKRAEILQAAGLPLPPPEGFFSRMWHSFTGIFSS